MLAASYKHRRLTDLCTCSPRVVYGREPLQVYVFNGGSNTSSIESVGVVSTSHGVGLSLVSEFRVMVSI